MIGIIDYGVGNLFSVKNTLDRLGAESFISSDLEELAKADKLILPGVGAFEEAMKKIKDHQIDRFLNQAKENGKPILGICLGMQLLFEVSYEHGEHQGLGMIEGKVVPIETSYKVPHMGWNRLSFPQPSPITKEMGEEEWVYFVHSYHVITDEKWVIATTNYGKELQVGVQKDLVFGLQFHPEKSGQVGLKMLKNFMEA